MSKAQTTRALLLCHSLSFPNQPASEKPARVCLASQYTQLHCPRNVVFLLQIWIGSWAFCLMEMTTSVKAPKTTLERSAGWVSH